MNGKSDKVQTVQQKPETSSASTDLLGLDLISSANDEPFGFFTSADSTNKSENANKSIETKTIEDEEKDFFSQKIPDKSEEKKLTKESILSLYSQIPTSSQMNGFMVQPVNSLNQQFSSGNPPYTINAAKSVGQ